MGKPTVKGAGDSGMRENPRVTSKFDRSHGMPRTPATVTHPGGTAPMTGTKVAGHTESGHMLPQEATHARGEAGGVKHHYDPQELDSRMARGQPAKGEKNETMTDSFPVGTGKIR